MTVDPKYNVSKPGTSAECKSTLVMSSPSVVFFFLARVTIRSFFFIFSGFGSFSFWSFFNRSSWLCMGGCLTSQRSKGWCLFHPQICGYQWSAEGGLQDGFYFEKRCHWQECLVCVRGVAQCTTREIFYLIPAKQGFLNRAQKLITTGNA